MLRNKDYELAIELGILDEDTVRKIQDSDVCADDCEHEGSRPLEKELYKLQDVIICLSKELLKKEETIKRLQDDFNRLSSNKDEISEYWYRTKQDLRLLEQIIDKLENDGKKK